MIDWLLDNKEIIELFLNIISTIIIPIIIAYVGYVYQRENKDKQLIIDLFKDINSEEDTFFKKSNYLINDKNSDLSDLLNQHIKNIYNLLNNELLLFQLQNKSRINFIKNLCELLAKTKIYKADSNMTEEECTYLLDIGYFINQIKTIIICNDNKILEEYKKIIKY